MFSLESPQMSTHNIPFSIQKENHPKIFQLSKYGIFFKGLKKHFETAAVNEPSVFEPLKFYCMLIKLAFLRYTTAFK